MPYIYIIVKLISLLNQQMIKQKCEVKIARRKQSTCEYNVRKCYLVLEEKLLTFSRGVTLLCSVSLKQSLGNT